MKQEPTGVAYESHWDGDQPGAIPYIGIPAWKTHNVRRDTIRKERNETSSDEKLGIEEKE